MRTVLLALPLALMASAASAQPMPNSLSMSCAGARDLVSRSGAIVIGTGQHADREKRFHLDGVDARQVPELRALLLRPATISSVTLRGTGS